MNEHRNEVEEKQQQQQKYNKILVIYVIGQLKTKCEFVWKLCVKFSIQFNSIQFSLAHQSERAVNPADKIFFCLFFSQMCKFVHFDNNNAR